MGRYYVGSVGASGVVTGVGSGIGLLSRVNTNFDASSAVDTRKPFGSGGSAPDPAEGAHSAPANP